MTKSMTEGSPLKLILQFSLPLLAGNIFQQLYNIVDAAIVGKILGANALGSVGASSSVQFLVLGFCIGVCIGFSIPVAQKFGAQDMAGMRKSIFHGGMLTVLFAVILTIGCSISTAVILRILQTPDEIFADAYSYLLVIFLGIPFTMLYNFLSGLLRAVGDSKTPFIFLTLSAILNIILDLFFIIVLKWGCAGAAIATIISQGVSGILCLILIIIKFDLLHPRKEDMKFDGYYARQVFVMGVPMGLQYSITAIGSMVLQSANNSLGTTAVSAFTAALKIKQFAMCPFDAFATAISTFVSQNYGAGKFDRLKKGVIQGTTVSVSYGVIIGIVLILFGRDLSLLLVNADNTAVLQAAALYLKCMGFFYWTLGILNSLRMSTQGLGFSGRAVFSGATEMIARIVISLVFVPMYGYYAICWADQTAWVSACFYIVPTFIYCVRKLTVKK